MGRPAAPVREFHCPTCGGGFRVPDKAERRKYCSSACQPRGIHRGKDNSSYNGGLSFAEDKHRWRIVCRDGSQEYFARAVVAAHLGRDLSPGEIVHHINHDSTDDRIENLQVVTRAEHMDLHRDELLAARPPKKVKPPRPPRAKLTESDVVAIRRSSESARGIAERFGVSVWTIYDVRRKRRWRSVEDE